MEENIDIIKNKKKADVISVILIFVILALVVTSSVLFRDKGGWESLGYILVIPIYIIIGVLGVVIFSLFSKRKAKTFLLFIMMFFSVCSLTFVPLLKASQFLEAIWSGIEMQADRNLSEEEAITNIKDLFENGVDASIMGIEKNFMIVSYGLGPAGGSGHFAVYMPDVDGDKFESFSGEFERVGDSYFAKRESIPEQNVEIMTTHKILIKLDMEKFNQDLKAPWVFDPVMQSLLNRQRHTLSVNYDYYTKEIPVLFYLDGELINDKFKL